MTELLLATGNPGKLRELVAALEPRGIQVVGLDTLEDPTPVEETGATFEQNARLKAEGYSLRTDLHVLADDSGLEVDALGGDPGVRSARYGGEGYDDAGRTQLVLERTEGVPEKERTARFRAVLALARHGETLATFEGVAEGRLFTACRGENGFGYDPIFFSFEAGTGFAQIGRAEKERYSHRGQAIRKLLAWLEAHPIER